MGHVPTPIIGNIMGRRPGGASKNRLSHKDNPKRIPMNPYRNPKIGKLVDIERVLSILPRLYTLSQPILITAIGYGSDKGSKEK